jgi:hypothetical protein
MIYGFKNAEFFADFESVEKMANHLKKIINKRDRKLKF